MRRVVITGLGALSGFGTGVETLWQAVLAGRASERDVMLADGTAMVAAAVPDLDADGLFGRREARRMDRCGHLAAAAAAQALADAGSVSVPPERIGAAFGTAHGGVATLDAAYAALASRGPERVSPLAIPLSLPNNAATAAARACELRGPTLAPATACAAGADAIGLAAMHVRSGAVDAMVAGGAEAPLSPVVVAGYRRSGALCGEAHPVGRRSRPFDRDRDGFILAEGAGALVLEEREHALERGARVYCELVGYAASCDASHLTDPEPSGAGAARAISAALADAGARAEDVGYVNAHATSTRAGDTAELVALERAGLLGVPTSSTKGATGHALGAAGGIETVITALVVSRRRVPPTANLTTPDAPAAAWLPLEATPCPELTLAISSSLGFGGQNACVALAGEPD